MTSKTNEGARESGLPFESVKFKDELYHEDASQWERVFSDMGGNDYRGSSIVSGAALKGCIAAGLIESPETEVLKDKRGKSRYFIGGLDVDKMSAAQVITIGVQCLRYYRSMTEPDSKN